MIRAVFLIAAAELVAFGLLAPRLGFYSDDWTFLEKGFGGARGLAAAVSAFAAGGYWTRPVQILQFPSAIALGRLDPFPYQVLMVLGDAAAALLFFRLLDRLLGSRELASAAAVLALLYPNRAAAHFWFAASSQTVAIMLALASLLFFLGFVNRRSRAALLAGLALYVAAVLSYESVAFLPLLVGGAQVMRSRETGRDWGKALRDGMAPLWPYLAALLAAIALQAMAAKMQGYNPKSAGLSLGHALKVFGAGFECLTNRTLHVCWKTLPAVMRESGPSSWGIWVGFSLGGAAALRLGGIPAQVLRLAAGAAAGGFIGAYLPYALSSSYVPQVFGPLSRGNGVGALIGGLGLAAALAAAARKAPRAAIGASALAVWAFTGADWGQARVWARVWEAERAILASVSPQARHLPRGSVVVLEETPRTDRPAAFNDHYDFAAALRLWAMRPDLQGEVRSPRLTMEARGVVVRGEDGSERRHEYARTYLYREETGSLESLRKPSPTYPPDLERPKSGG